MRWTEYCEMHSDAKKKQCPVIKHIISTIRDAKSEQYNKRSIAL